MNPLTGEQKIIGVPTLDNGAPASLEEAQADGDDHENGDDRSEADPTAAVSPLPPIMISRYGRHKRPASS